MRLFSSRLSCSARSTRAARPPAATTPPGCGRCSTSRRRSRARWPSAGVIAAGATPRRSPRPATRADCDLGELGAAAAGDGNPAGPLVQRAARPRSAATPRRSCTAARPARTSLDTRGDAGRASARWCRCSPTSQAAADAAPTLADATAATLDGRAAPCSSRRCRSPSACGPPAGWRRSTTPRAPRRACATSDSPCSSAAPPGTLAALGDDGLGGARAAGARRLGLPRAGAALAHATARASASWPRALGGAAGAAGKVARDVVLLAQTEVGEVREGGRGGGSSAMPHKRNPVAAVAALACSSAGARAGRDACWPRWPGARARRRRLARRVASRCSELLRLTGSAARRGCARRSRASRSTPARMRANLDATGGLLMAERVGALGWLGRAQARRRGRGGRRAGTSPRALAAAGAARCWTAPRSTGCWTPARTSARPTSWSTARSPPTERRRPRRPAPHRRPARRAGARAPQLARHRPAHVGRAGGGAGASASRSSAATPAATAARRPRPARTTIADLGGDVIALLDHLGRRARDLAGVSLGGMTAMWLGRPRARAGRPPRRSAARPRSSARPRPGSTRAATVRAEGVAAVADAVVDALVHRPARRRPERRAAARR